jgi:hypothetical protein
VLLAAVVVSNLRGQCEANTHSAISSQSWCESVLAHGALGDGVHDDTASFNAAAMAAAAVPTGHGCVVVPPVAPGKGYVITSTVTLPVGVSIIGTPTGLPVVPWCYSPPFDSNSTGGPRILARPSATASKTAPPQPLFHLGPGCSARGLFILYDRMPFPTDAQFADPSSPYYYPGGFTEAVANFYPDHVPDIGPTFYVQAGTRVVIEDIVGSGFKDFIFFGRGGGQSHVRRVHGWGYGRMVTVLDAADVFSFDTLRYIINAGPHCLGPAPDAATCHADPTIERCRGDFTWLPGVVALHPDNVGLWLGRCDGYAATDLFFFGVNTAVRLGYSSDFPMLDATTGKSAPPLAPATGPWGAIAQLMVDQCVRGIHMVWPNPLSNRFSQVQIHPSFWLPNHTFAAANGSGALLDQVGLEAAIMVESSHCLRNNAGLSSPTMLSQFVVASFDNSALFGAASATLTTSNGRVFIVRGDILVEGFGLSVNNVPTASNMLWASGANASLSIRIRGVILNNAPTNDIDISTIPHV